MRADPGNARPSLATKGPGKSVSTETVPAPIAVDAKVAAGLLDICERTLDKLRQRGEIPSVKIGRCRRYRTIDLIAFVDRLAAEQGAEVTR